VAFITLSALKPPSVAIVTLWRQRAFERLADYLLGAAKAVDRSGVDQCHATINGRADRRDRLSLVSTTLHPAAHRPGAEANARGHQTRFDEFNLFHDDLLLPKTEARSATAEISVPREGSTDWWSA
jgi:hypothetical protein